VRYMSGPRKWMETNVRALHHVCERAWLEGQREDMHVDVYADRRSPVFRRHALWLCSYAWSSSSLGNVHPWQLIVAGAAAVFGRAGRRPTVGPPTSPRRRCGRSNHRSNQLSIRPCRCAALRETPREAFDCYVGDCNGNAGTGTAGPSSGLTALALALPLRCALVWRLSLFFMTSKTLKSARSTPDLAKAARAGREFICKLCQQKITDAEFIVSTVRLSAASCLSFV
jgi:hypothetical protein